jgi:hypothetical protein
LAKAIQNLDNDNDDGFMKYTQYRRKNQKQKITDESVNAKDIAKEPQKVKLRRHLLKYEKQLIDLRAQISDLNDH